MLSPSAARDADRLLGQDELEAGAEQHAHRAPAHRAPRARAAAAVAAALLAAAAAGAALRATARPAPKAPAPGLFQGMAQELVGLSAGLSQRHDGDVKDKSSRHAKDVKDKAAAEPEAPGVKLQSILKKKPKTKFEELPKWVAKNCTEHDSMAPNDCSKTKCCKESGMQCFEKEPGWAICDTDCLPGAREGDGYWQCNRLGPQTPIQCPKCAPTKTPKPDIVILFFERDLCKMKYTARSIGVNDPDHNLGEVYLMWVSSKPASEYQEDIDVIKSAIEEYKTVHFVDWSERMASAQPHPIGGWHAQQMVKLKIAHEIQSDFYIVLDSKNTLITPVTQDTFFTSCGQGIIQAEFPFDNIPPPHIDWYALSAEVLGVDPPDSGFWPASITPIVMHKATVIEMLESIGEDPSPEALCNGPLCESLGAFSDSGVGATEFTLYTLWAYAKRANGTFDCIHSIEKLQHFKVNYTEDWKDVMQQHISGFGFPEDPTQITVSNGDGYPLDWTPGQEEEPEEDQFPLSFEDLTHKWASSLWRGEESNAELLIEVNLHTLADVVSGVRQFPVMFGAQPASLKPMSTEQRKTATDKLVEMYKKANLYDPDDDLVNCTIGWKN